MVAQTLGGDSRPHDFEVLLYTYFGGWTGFAYDEDDEPVRFGNIEEALTDLQGAFDIWARQVIEGERTLDQAFSPDDFAIRSRHSGELCRILTSRNEVMLRSKDGKGIQGLIEFARINSSGRFET